MSAFTYEKDNQNIVTLTLKQLDDNHPTSDAAFRAALSEVVEKLQAEKELLGVVITSDKNAMALGTDISDLLEIDTDNPAGIRVLIDKNKANFRDIDKLPVPVVAAIQGSVSGAGLELALSANHRIALQDGDCSFGLHEASQGFLPLGGGITRLVNTIGVAATLPIVMENKTLTLENAIEAGLVKDTAETNEVLLAKAKAFIIASTADEAASQQPWDTRKHKIPGGGAATPKVAQLIPAITAMLAKNTRGAHPALEKALDTVIEAAKVGFDAALKIESKWLTYLLIKADSRNKVAS